MAYRFAILFFAPARLGLYRCVIFVQHVTLRRLPDQLVKGSRFCRTARVLASPKLHPDSTTEESTHSGQFQRSPADLKHSQWVACHALIWARLPRLAGRMQFTNPSAHDCPSLVSIS